MKAKHTIVLLVISVLSCIGWKTFQNNWQIEKQKNYTLFYTSNDTSNKKEYKKLIDNGITSVKNFFKSSYSEKFNVYIHPNRNSLDSTWQKDWNMPDFKSECWMVASGVGTKLDVISPKKWDKQACEHVYSETEKTQKLIIHELFHVYHGQLNASPDFSNTEKIDWFVEGFATFASSQCDSDRMSEVKKAIIENKIPKSLDNFWSGKIKYGLSGSVVMYIDYKYGRATLKKLLPLTKKTEILSFLKITEEKLLEDWKKYIINL